MKNNFLVAALCLLLTLAPAAVFAQTEAFGNNDVEMPLRKAGLSASIQNSEWGISVPLFFSRQFSVAPSVGFTYAEGIGSDLSLALIPKVYLSNNRFMPYVALRVGAVINFPPENSTMSQEKRTDYLTGLGFGGEYFLGPNFSFGVEAQGNMTISDENSGRFGNPGGKNFNLGTAVTANIYFLK